MPLCHHCGKKITENDVRFGTCSTCQTTTDFCPICGWWELGPDLFMGTESSKRVAAKLKQPLFPEVVPCLGAKAEQATEAVGKIVEQCGLMQKQRKTSSLFQKSDYAYRLWRPELATWEDAATQLVTAYDSTFTSELHTNLAPRMHAMLVTYASAFELCARAQQQRLITAQVAPPINFHDVARMAELHYREHKGFGHDGRFLELDALTLRHVVTLEQYLKGNMRVQIAHWRLRRDVNSRAVPEIIENAALIYVLFLSVIALYEDQTIPSKSTLSPSGNWPPGFYSPKHIKQCYYQGDLSQPILSMSLKKKLKTLEDTFLDELELRPHPIFHSKKSVAAITGNKNLTENQMLYLLLLQDLDAPDCPSECRKVLLDRAAKRLDKLVVALAKSQLVNKLKAAKLPLTLLEFAGAPDTLIQRVMTHGQQGGFRLQTCGNDLHFIKSKVYGSVLSVYEGTARLAEILAGCQASQASKVVVTGFGYTKTQALTASDNRKKTPFQYTSWRQQKDLMAHHFLLDAFSEYDATAALSPTLPVPEPQATYGDKMIVWKPAVIGQCTFKIGDSGRPTRSFLQLLDDLLEAAQGWGNIVHRLALLNLLLLACEEPVDLRSAYSQILKNWQVVYPETQKLHPGRGIDLEAHLYGTITLKDVDLILHPFTEAVDSEAKLVSSKLTGEQTDYGTKDVFLYNKPLFETMEQERIADFDWQILVAQLELK